MADHFSPDLIWEITRKRSAMLVKRKQAGGVQFSKDPLNLTNIHSRKYEGFVNDKAIGVQPAANQEKGVTLFTKKSHQANKPASELQTTTFGPSTSSRKTYRSIVSQTAGRGYRPDLRQSAVARASAIKLSQKDKKANPPVKLRGARAKKAKDEGKA
ncbi:ribosomal protein L28e [Rhizodiscina lignyota]|uniref:Ribosomal protein L28e n=1 Tax=Rhizodiscina lignyota TaxID=1504668 RepID=A0A9P4M1W5_9PEZI|nr:ribosomal protein L28e [Rhizodiscina lignyota]